MRISDWSSDVCSSDLQPWAPQLAELGVPHVTHVAGLNQSAAYVPQIAAVLRPEGQFALIDDPVDLDIGPFKGKSISIHWELMFTRAMFTTGTIRRQHALLSRVAEMFDRGDTKHNLTERIEGERKSERWGKKGGRRG